MIIEQKQSEQPRKSAQNTVEKHSQEVEKADKNLQKAPKKIVPVNINNQWEKDEAIEYNQCLQERRVEIKQIIDKSFCFQRIKARLPMEEYKPLIDFNDYYEGSYDRRFIYYNNGCDQVHQNKLEKAHQKKELQPQYTREIDLFQGLNIVQLPGQKSDDLDFQIKQQEINSEFKQQTASVPLNDTKDQLQSLAQELVDEKKLSEKQQTKIQGLAQYYMDTEVKPDDRQTQTSQVQDYQIEKLRQFDKESHFHQVWQQKLVQQDAVLEAKIQRHQERLMLQEQYQDEEFQLPKKYCKDFNQGIDISQDSSQEPVIRNYLHRRKENPTAKQIHERERYYRKKKEQLRAKKLQKYTHQLVPSLVHEQSPLDGGLMGTIQIDQDANSDNNQQDPYRFESKVQRLTSNSSTSRESSSSSSSKVTTASDNQHHDTKLDLKDELVQQIKSTKNQRGRRKSRSRSKSVNKKLKQQTPSKGKVGRPLKQNNHNNQQIKRHKTNGHHRRLKRTLLSDVEENQDSFLGSESSSFLDVKFQEPRQCQEVNGRRLRARNTNVNYVYN